MKRRTSIMFRWMYAPCCALVALVLAAAPARADSQALKPSTAPVNFQARYLSHDDKAQTVTAVGDVELVQGQKILHADKMVYHLDTDTVQAIGNVSLLDDEGNVHFAEYVELTKDMKNGFVHDLLSLLADGSRFTAVEAKRENGTKMTMTEATYTACKVCETDPHPLWQIKADKVMHDAETHTVSYKNARLDFDGIPIAFAPIFSHADPTVKRKAGLLRPTAGYSSRLGAFAQGGYYFDIAPDKDATLMLKPTAREGVLAEAEWRQRFTNGEMQIDASGVRSDRKEQDGTISQDKWRGHVFADGLFDLSDTWRSGFDLQRVTDKEYLRLYDLSRQNVLTSDLYAERFSGRDYARISAMDFQDVRLGTRPDQPGVLPMMEADFMGEPDAMLGGRWEFGASALGLSRKASGQDVQQGAVSGGWQRRDILPVGIVTQVNLSGREDVFAIQNSDAAKLNPALDSSTVAWRGMGVASATASYPLVKRLDRMQLVVGPKGGISASPHIDETNTKVPDEDSIDTELDANNLFSNNRFTGVDQQEDGVRANYGVEIGGYGDSGRYVRGFLGESYRFQRDLAFPRGSGLEDHASDIVGYISASLSEYLSGDYRFQVDNNFSVRRHELQATAGNDKVSANTHYIYIDDIAGTGFTVPRQQLQFGGSYHFTPEWWATADTLTDMSQLDPGLRKASFGLNYADECFSFTAEGVRNFLNDASGDRGTVLLFRVGFKHIGAFSAPNIHLNNRDTTTQ